MYIVTQESIDKVMGFKTSLGLEALLVLIDLTASTFYG